MGRAAIFEKLQVELDILCQALFLSLLFQHLISVFTLGASGDFDPAPDQIIALGNAIFIPHVVECPLFRAVVGDEEKLVVVVLFDPLIAQFFSFRGQITLFRFLHLISKFRLQAGIQLRQSNHRERLGGNHHFQAEGFFDLLPILLFDMGEGIGEQILLHFHHIMEGGDIAELQVKAAELRGVLACEGLLSPEDGASLEDTLKTGGHGHLFIKLRALG